MALPMRLRGEKKMEMKTEELKECYGKACL
jgi:hypothetical protein